ncbi:MAG TPA: hypothetical protein PLY79_10905 [Ferruginibacter sp.]|nr:hypothetical protein [Ferruginibacter sp.]
MQAQEVNPNDWNLDENYPIRVLYDDGEFSIIWGMYQNRKSLGTRWNGGIERGFPGQGAHPTWYIEPPFIAIAILQRIFTLALDTTDHKYIENIKFAISELTAYPQ